MGRTEFWNSEHDRTPIRLLLPHILDFPGAALVIDLVFAPQRSNGRDQSSLRVAKSLWTAPPYQGSSLTSGPTEPLRHSYRQLADLAGFQFMWLAYNGPYFQTFLHEERRIQCTVRTTLATRDLAYTI